MMFMMKWLLSQGLEKAVGETMPNAGKKIESIIKSVGGIIDIWCLD